ncbi:MAG: hypothetical protein E6490_00105 [Bifidobacterium longum]|uniref:hypothetical protein n=1 Tax=Bifidobacterium longum TaxID=216816 RepID=UPI00290AFD6A|nr:hypothetical protein [Bifidobacterium longum]
MDGIARDLGAFWLLDQWFTVGLHGWAESMISSSLSDRNRTFCQSVFRASDAANPKYVPLLKEHRDMLFDRVRGGVAGLDSAAMDYVGLRAARCRAGAGTLFRAKDSVRYVIVVISRFAVCFS